MWVGHNQHQPKGFNFSDHGLKKIKIHIWHDWIFINFNGKAKKFIDYAKPLIKKFNDIDFTKLRYGATLDFGKINTNWKFLIENFIEPYHVQFVHKSTTNQPLKIIIQLLMASVMGVVLMLKKKILKIVKLYLLLHATYHFFQIL